MERKEFSRPKLPEGMVESPPMVIHDISRLYSIKMGENEGPMQQPSVRSMVMNLAREDGLTQLELAHRTHLSTPTISVIAKRLDAQGYIKRSPDRYDMRALRVYLTERGRELVETAHTASEAADDILMEGFSPEESRQLLEMLDRMRENMERHLGLGEEAQS